MKKTLKYSLFFTLIISLSIIFCDRAYAKECNEYTYENCPSSCIADTTFLGEKACYSCEELFIHQFTFAGGEKAEKTCNSYSICTWVATKNSMGLGVCRTKLTTKPKSETKIIIEGKTSFKCSDVKHLTSIWMLLRIISPFLVVLFGSLDFFKSLAAGDEKKMKESRGKFIKRLIAFFLLILLPFMLQFIFTNIGTNGSQNMCLIKCITTNNTSSKGCD